MDNLEGKSTGLVLWREIVLIGVAMVIIFYCYHSTK